jgi:hypothetical protein
MLSSLVKAHQAKQSARKESQGVLLLLLVIRIQKNKILKVNFQIPSSSRKKTS